MSPLRKVLLGASVSAIAFVVAAVWWRVDGDRMPEIQIPEPVEIPEPNAFDLLVEAFGTLSDPEAVGDVFLRTRYPVDDRPGEPVIFEAQEEVVLENQETLRLVRDALNHSLVYPDPYEMGSGRGDVQFGDIRMLARLLALESEVHRHQGRFGPAMHAALDAMELGRLVGRRSILIAALTGVGMVGIGFENVPEILSKLNREEMRTVHDRLAGIAEMGFETQVILAAERDFVLEMLKSLFAEEDWRLNLAKGAVLQRLDREVIPNKPFDEIELGDFSLRYQVEIRLITWRYHKGRMVSTFKEMMAQAIDAVDGPFPNSEGMFPGPDPTLPWGMNDMRGIRRVWFSILMERVNQDMLAATIALELWHWDHGAYPENLSELKESGLTRVPRDPFADNHGPLRYRRDDGSYILYSVGPNGEDNGGMAMEADGWEAERRYIPRLDLPGDVVAGVNVLRRGGG